MIERDSFWTILAVVVIVGALGLVFWGWSDCRERTCSAGRVPQFDRGRCVCMELAK